MTIAVVVADRHQADPGLEDLVQGFALIGGAVVGDLHDVHDAERAGAA